MPRKDRMTQPIVFLIKELRDRTGASLKESRDALAEANGDIELAIYKLQKYSQINDANAMQKAGHVAAENSIVTKEIKRGKKRWLKLLLL